MSITIRREIEVKRKGLPVVIDVTYGTDLIQMGFKVTDCMIPAESSAVAYSQGRTAEVHKQICTIDENVISFTPEKSFFEEGRNELQLRVVHNNRSLFTFKCRVECQGSFADSDAEEVKRNSSLVEQLMTEQAVTKARLEEVLKLPEDGSDVEKAVNDIKVGADGKVYSSPGEAVRQQIGQVSEQIDELDSDVYNEMVTQIFDRNNALIERFVIRSSTGEIAQDYVNSTICVMIKPNTKYTVKCSKVSRKKIGTLTSYPEIGKVCTNYSCQTESSNDDMIIVSGENDIWLAIDYFDTDSSEEDKNISSYIYATSVYEHTKIPKLQEAFDGIDEIKSDLTYEKILTVAAFDTSEKEKRYANYICDGVNDEIEIQKALDSLGYKGEVRLTSGTFNIDSFTLSDDGKYRAIRLNRADIGSTVTQKTISGSGKRTNKQTKIVVTDTALGMLPTDCEAMVFSDNAKNGFVYGRVINYRDFSVYLYNNQHPVCVFDNSEFTTGEMHSITASGVMPDISNTEATPMPNVKCIGVRGYSGNDSGTNNLMSSCFVTGFYEGYQLGGEHLVGIQVNGRYNYYTFTFNNYDFKMGTMSHPITLINCADEHSACLPYFKKNTYYGEGGEAVHQAINLIGYNLEVIGAFDQYLTLPAEEEDMGSYRGRIEFTGYGRTNVEDGYMTGVHAQNLVAIKFFADGHGHGFITRNLAHKLAGTTAERNTYVPTYMQEYFDTDLNKKLIYNGENWIDYNGTVVD